MAFRIKEMTDLGKCFLILSGVFLLVLTGLAFAGENLTGKSDPKYQPRLEAVSILQKVAEDTEIILFHGAWCSDCRREVPRFMRILEVVDNSHLRLTEYEVNREKQDVLGKFEEYGVKFVPTFIVVREGGEMGRIVEKPQKSLEDDLAAILAGKK
jgi:thiol-disulfide isomerase/thioredoxin